MSEEYTEKDLADAKSAVSYLKRKLSQQTDDEIKAMVQHNIDVAVEKVKTIEAALAEPTE